MHRAPLRHAALLLLALALAAPSRAQIVPTAQTRGVSGSAFATDGSGTLNDADSDAAPGFAPFAAAVSADATLPDAIGTGGGEQNSTIAADRITASGSAFATAESFAFDSSADGSGDSRTDVSFTLTGNAFYTLTGFIAAFDSGSTDLTLTRGATTVLATGASGDQVDLDEAGLLTAGDYQLVVLSTGFAFGDQFASEFAFAEYDVDFRVQPTTAVPGLGALGSLLAVATLAGVNARRLRRPAR